MTNVTTPLQHGRLQAVLDVLLDLANEGEKRWRQIRDKQNERVATLNPSAKKRLDRRIDDAQNNWLRDALIVKWEETGKENCLLVTSSRYEKADREMEVGTITAIRRCLLLCKNISYSHDQTLDTFKLLDELGLLEDRTDEKMKNDGHRCFRINFSAGMSREHGDCKAFVKSRWQEKFGPKQTTPATAKPRSKDPDSRLRRRLDTFVSCHKAAVEKRLSQRRKEEKKHLHVPLEVQIVGSGSGDGAGRVCCPEPADLRAVVEGEGGQLLLIWGVGGAGKTSLAFAIADWAVQGRLAAHELLPFFWEPLGDPAEEMPLGQRVAEYLNNLSGGTITPEEVDDLLRHKRLLLIADHFSELTDAQRSWLERNLPAKSVVLLTSRLRDHGKRLAARRGFTLTEIQPQPLQEEELFRFFREYLHQRGLEEGKDGPEPWLSPDDYMETRSLLERTVGNQPTTVLLAWMVIEKAIQHISARKDNRNPGVKDLLPSSVPELMEEYVKTSGLAIAEPDRFFAHCPELEPQQILILMKALALEAHRQEGRYQPQNFSADLASRAWATALLDGKPLEAAEQQRLLVYMRDRLTLLSSKPPVHGVAMYRIALDPLADYLAALKQRELWEESLDHREEVQRWLSEQIGRRRLAELDEDDPVDPLPGMRGFLAACRDGYRQWLNRFGPSLDPAEREKWEGLLNHFAREAKIDQAGERILAAKHLIRRHATDLEWANPKLRGEAIAGLTAFAKEFKALPNATGTAAAAVRALEGAVAPLMLTMIQSTFPEADRAAAAEALGHIGGPRVADALIQQLAATGEPVAVRRAAAEALGLVDGPPEDPAAHWHLLRDILANEANHLHGASFEVMDAKLPLLQGAARGLQRLASRSRPHPLPDWGSAAGLSVPMLTLTISAGAVTTQLVEKAVWQLPLPDGQHLEVVEILGGAYTIGSPPGEVGRDAYGHRPEATDVEVEARREVTVPTFGMARFPITQAQWRTLAGPEHQREGDRELKLDPSQHKGADLPVENVSWRDCQEWLKRLNRWLEKNGPALGLSDELPQLGLPSESLWEVACRAGTPLSTPFHFGDSLDASWANYDASPDYIYPGGRAGLHRQRPSAVGACGLVNEAGLADLHGNVWEWCADVWHPSPLGGPLDGRPWVEPAQGVLDMRLLRGGSWFNVPHGCRSAARNSSPPASLGGDVGFRVCCLPPGLPSWSFNP